LVASKDFGLEILKHMKGLSKEIIRTLSSHFKLFQEAFNSPCKFKLPLNASLRNLGVIYSNNEQD